MNVPASALQQELWHLDQHHGAGPALIVPAGWRLDGPLDIPALAAAVDALLARHEGLRARFQSEDGVAVLDIVPARHGNLEVVRLPDASSADEELRHFCRQSFDLARGPLTRARLWCLGPQTFLLGFSFHHVVVDAWSLDLIESELGQLYRQAVAGQTLDPTPAYSLVALVGKLNDTVQDECWHEDLRYWTERLRQASGLELPAVPRAPGEAPAFAAHRIRRELAAGIAERLCGARGVTVFHGLLGAFAGVLARWCNTGEVVIGVPIAARAAEQLSDVVMFTTNVAPIRVDLAGDPSFAEVTGQVRDGVHGALAHQSVALSELLRHLDTQPGQDVAGLAAVAATHRRYTGEGLEIDSVAVTRLTLDTDFALYQLAMHVEQRPDAVWIELESRHLGPPDLLALWDRLHGVLAAVAASPESVVSQWPMRPARPGGTLVQPKPGGVATVPEAFLRTATSFPSATAIVAGDATVTYRQLLEAAGAVARTLESTPSDVVAVCVRRGPAMLSAALGIMLAGRTYLPVDPAWPSARISRILDDAGVSLVLTDSWQMDLPGLAGRELLMAWPQHGHVPSRAAPAAQSAYLLYTSGSTGVPKGVLFGYDALANVLEQMRRLTEVAPGKRVLASTTVTFDISVVELLLPMVCGATCVIADDDTMRDPALLAQLIAREKADLVQATPTMWQALLDHLTVDVPVAIAAGEPMTDLLRDRLLQRSGRCYNGYGPTETHYATFWRAQRDAPVSIGHAIEGLTAWVLDRWDRPCAEYTVGRLVLSGVGVGDGYLNRAELTAQRFRRGLPGLTEERAYETGDLASVGRDGLLYLHGRADDQIKLRGYRIELGEIEAVVAAVPGVSAAAAVPYSVGEDQRGLAVFVVPQQGHDESDLTGRIRAAAAESLPEYMRPQLIRLLERLPLTSSGKTSRLELSRGITVLDVPVGQQSEAVSPVQLQLEQIWGEMLGLSRVPVRTSFFELGGDSIGAARLVARIKKMTDTRISLQEFLADPTIDGVSQLLAKASR